MKHLVDKQKTALRSNIYLNCKYLMLGVARKKEIHPLPLKQMCMKSLPAKLLLPAIITCFVFSCNKEEICTACLAYENDIAPIANAGADIQIKFDKQNCTYETVTLDGSLSKDSDGKITSYTWRVIAPYKEEIYGSESKIIFNHSGKGEYLIQLKVFDNLGKYAFDTVKVTVMNDVVSTFSNLDIQLSLIADFSAAYRYQDLELIGGSEKKLLFYEYDGFFIENIIMFDIQSGQGKKIILPQQRSGFATLVTDEKIFFIGGWSDLGRERTVDIYDLATGKMSTISLTEARDATTSTEYLGTKVFFIGGTQGDGEISKTIKNMEIYDTLTKNIALFPFPDNCSNNYVKAENKLYFADFSSNSINRNTYIFDMQTNSWTTLELKIPVNRYSGVAVSNNIYWLSAYSPNFQDQRATTDAFAVYNTQNNTSGFTCLPEPERNSPNIFSKNNKILIANNYQDFSDPKSPFGYVFNPSSGEWYKAINKNNISPIYMIQIGKEVFALSQSKIYRVDF